MSSELAVMSRPAGCAVGRGHWGLRFDCTCCPPGGSGPCARDAAVDRFEITEQLLIVQPVVAVRALARVHGVGVIVLWCIGESRTSVPGGGVVVAKGWFSRPWWGPSHARCLGKHRSYLKIEI